MIRPADVSLRWKITIAILVVTAIGAVAIAVFFPPRLERQAFRALESKTQTVATILSYNLVAALEFHDEQAVVEALEGVLRDEEVDVAGVFAPGDHTGGPRYVAGDPELLSSIPDAVGPAISPTHLYVTVPVESASGPVGRLVVASSLARVHADVASHQGITLLVSVLVGIAGLVLGLMLARRITSPLAKLSSAASRMSRGERGVRVEVGSRDEIGLLANTFNEMAASLEASREEIESSNRDLEVKVQARTAELEVVQRELRLGYELSMLISKSRESSTMLSGVLGFVANELAWDRALIQSIGGEVSATLLAAYGWEETGPRHLGSHLLTRLDLSEDAIVLRSPPSEEEAGWWGTDGPALVALLPIRVNGVLRAVGILFADDAMTPRRRSLRTVAGQLSVALESFLLMEERRATQSALIAAKDSAEKANVAKSQFLANMSHEIRTPMNGVLGMTELALETELDEGQREYLGVVKDSADALLHLIDDILDFSKIEAGKLTLESIQFEPRAVVEGVMDAVASRAVDQGIELTCFVDRQVPAILEGDPSRLRQVLMNLVGNALKFTTQGTVSLEILALEEGDAAAPRLEFAVEDTGIGIPPEKQETIFGAFDQADTSTTRKYGGTGLGLSISRRLIGMMGGEIRLESEVGRGSRFYFRLELPAPGHPVPVEPSALEGLRGLVVGGNERAGRDLRRALEQHGCRMAVALGTEEATAQLEVAAGESEGFDLVLVDLATCDPPRPAPDAGRPRILGLAPLGRRLDTEALDRLGLDGVLTKPLHPSHLEAKVSRALAPHGGEASRPLPEEFQAPMALRDRHILVVEDNAVNRLVAEKMLARLGCTSESAENGREGLERIRSGRFDAVLCDVQMPEMDGLEMTRAVREEERGGGAHVPIVAMTAHAMHGDEERCLEAGMDSYVSKPINRDALATALENLLLERVG